MIAQTILPPNATALERAFDLSIRDHVDVLPVPIRSVWDPMTCPPELLPWLAWGVSIDLWDSAWTTEVKRDAIAGAIDEQRRKGTRAAVRRALDRIDPLVGLTEWFEDPDNLEPFTFRLDLPDQTQSPVTYDTDTIARLLNDIGVVKPLRAHVIASYTLVAQAQLGVIGAVQFGGIGRIDLTADIALALDPVWLTFLQTEDGEPLQTEDGAFLEVE